MTKATPNRNQRKTTLNTNRFGEDLDRETAELVAIIRAEEGDAAAEERLRFERRSARWRFAFQFVLAAARVIDVVSRLLP